MLFMIVSERLGNTTRWTTSVTENRRNGNVGTIILLLYPNVPPPHNNSPDSRNQQQFLSQTSSCSEGTRQNGSARTTKQGRDPFPHHNNNGLAAASLSDGRAGLLKSARPGGGYFIVRTSEHQGCALLRLNANRGPLPAPHGQVLTVKSGGEAVR